MLFLSVGEFHARNAAKMSASGFPVGFFLASLGKKAVRDHYVSDASAFLLLSLQSLEPLHRLLTPEYTRLPGLFEQVVGLFEVFGGVFVLHA